MGQFLAFCGCTSGFPLVCLPCYDVMVNKTHKAAIVKFPDTVYHKDVWDYRQYEIQLTCQKRKTLPEEETKREVVELMSTFTLEVHQLRLQMVLLKRPSDSQVMQN